MIPHTLAAKAVRKVGPHVIYEVDTKKAKYYGIPWHSLGDWGKRKFENFVVLSHASELPKVLYV